MAVVKPASNGVVTIGDVKTTKKVYKLWKNGAAAIWLGPLGARVLTDREDRGTRPWVPPPPTPKPRAVSPLPLAPLDR